MSQTATPVIRLDRSRPFGTAHGECVPSDPHYRVRFWQGGLMNGHRILLPFDTNGELIKDDGKKEPFEAPGILPDGKHGTVTYQPLYDDKMRAYLDAKTKKMKAIASVDAPQIDEGEKEAEEDDVGPAEDNVDLAGWLRGDVQYEFRLVRAACKKRYGTNHSNKKELVPDLVIDQKLVSPDELCEEFKKLMPQDIAA